MRIRVIVMLLGFSACAPRPVAPTTTATIGAPAPAIPASPVAAVEPAAPTPAETRCTTVSPTPPEHARGIVASRRGAARTIRVHFGSSGDPYGDCTPHTWMPRRVPAAADPIQHAVDALFRGPTDFERKHGITDAFGRSTSAPDLPILRRDQVKVRVRDGIATVDYAGDASHYVHQAQCAGLHLRMIFELTLLQFAGISEVRFTLAGDPLGEGDA